jgi:hypothetical protein
MLRLRRQRDRRDDSDSGLDTGLPQRREKTDFVDGVKSDPVSNVAQESFGSLDHAVALEV